MLSGCRLSIRCGNASELELTKATQAMTARMPPPWAPLPEDRAYGLGAGDRVDGVRRISGVPLGTLRRDPAGRDPLPKIGDAAASPSSSAEDFLKKIKNLLTNCDQY